MRNTYSFSSLILLALLVLFSAGEVLARAEFDIVSDQWQHALKPSAATPNLQFDLHNIGKMALTITNAGQFGTYGQTLICDGEVCPSCEYPVGSDIDYLFAGALWVGAVVGRDTLVSVGAEGWYGGDMKELLPEDGDDGRIISRSNLKSKQDIYSDLAISEQDFIAVFADTVVDPGYNGQDQYDNRPHIPIGVAIKQSSYAWSYDYAEDFVLFDYQLTNVGAFPIRDLYMGLYIDADVYHRSNEANGFEDDICGFRRTAKMPSEFCIDEDTVNIAWIADNDGDPTNDGFFSFSSPLAVTGTRVIRSPNKELQFAFNWWISNGNTALDFGPRYIGTEDDPFRPFVGSGTGTPTGDKNKYYVMSHREFDYDQLYTLQPPSDVANKFLPPPPPERAVVFADGYDTRYLLSFGPFNIDLGDTLPVTVAYLAGDNFHTGPRDFANYFDASDPERFDTLLNFNDFGTNARWASWIFDNPGVDTDEDGDSGKFCWNYTWVPDTLSPGDSVLVDSQKIYYGGDGVPDWRGAAPPPPPRLKVYPEFGKVTIRWNGEITENSFDVFSGRKDFEGYRVYFSEGERASDYILLTSYDLDDYKVFQFNTVLRTWEQVSVPLTIDDLRGMYGQTFNPLDYYNEFNYFTSSDNKLYYFQKQDWNQSDITDPNLIHKVYPDALKADSSDTTEEGFLRYYEYEYVVDNLNPSKPYYFSVTAFDYGSLKVDLGALESSPLINAVQEFPLPSSEKVEEDALDVIVYPNPYRIDAGYAEAGYENRDRTKSADRARAIHFANLPKICTIRIYTITGDLVKEIEHYYPSGGPGSQHEVWNVISRNTQAVVTGIYLWHVESDMGEQLGKLVIIK